MRLSFNRAVVLILLMLAVACTFGCARGKVVATFVDGFGSDLIYNGVTYYAVEENFYSVRYLYYFDTRKHLGYVEKSGKIDFNTPVSSLKYDEDEEFLYVYVTYLRDSGTIYSKNKTGISKSGKITAVGLGGYDPERIISVEDIEFLLSLEKLSGPPYSYDITHRPDPYVSRPVIYYENCPIAAGKLGHIVYTKDREWAYIPLKNTSPGNSTYPIDTIRHGFYIIDETVLAQLNRIMKPTVDYLDKYIK